MPASIESTVAGSGTALTGPVGVTTTGDVTTPPGDPTATGPEPMNGWPIRLRSSW